MKTNIRAVAFFLLSIATALASETPAPVYQQEGEFWEYNVERISTGRQGRYSSKEVQPGNYRITYKKNVFETDSHFGLGAIMDVFTPEKTKRYDAERIVFPLKEEGANWETTFYPRNSDCTTGCWVRAETSYKRYSSSPEKYVFRRTETWGNNKRELEYTYNSEVQAVEYLSIKYTGGDGNTINTRATLIAHGKEEPPPPKK